MAAHSGSDRRVAPAVCALAATGAVVVAHAPKAADDAASSNVSSSRRAHDPCASRDGETACGWPVGRLEPGGVVVVWENGSFPGWTLATTAGAKTHVGRRRARQTTARPGECGSIGGDETIHVAVERPVRSSWTSVTACLRRPGLAAGERRLAALLASTRFLAP